jgi:multidrug efflux pump subunit AcrA (membrane-fusion protein)
VFIVNSSNFNEGQQTNVITMKNVKPLPKTVKYTFVTLLFVVSACQSENETLTPVRQSITESVYASGLIKSKSQYEAFSAVSGIVNQVFVNEGAAVEIGTPLLSIANDAQQLTTDNAKLSAEFNALNLNRGKIDEAKSFVNLMNNQLENDVIMLKRQQSLWSQNVGTKVELEKRELALKNSKNNVESAKEKLRDLERQLAFQSKQAQNNLKISRKNTSDYLLKSKIKGKVYQLNINKGEIISPQKPVAIIGDNETYLLEMQIDEYDIVAIRIGMPVLVVLNSYRDSVFKAIVTRINPIMNLQSKTFTVEATFANPPDVLYPNVSFEANVVIKTKKDALLIPRNYLLNDSTVVNKSGEKLSVKTGLKDYQMIEILSGVKPNEELIIPEQ